MRVTEVLARRLFDGRRWTGPTRLRLADRVVHAVDAWEGPAGAGVAEVPARADRFVVDTVLPGLVDFGVSVSGYADLPDESAPYAPERAFARMALRHGVTTMVDVNNSAGPVSYLRSLAADGCGPRVLHSAGRLSDQPRGRHDLVVGVSSVRSAVDRAAAAGADLISVGPGCSPGTFRACRDAAREVGLPLALPRPTRPETPGLLVLEPGAMPDAETIGDAWSIAEGGAVAPQLHAAARWSVEGLLAADDAYLAAPVLPHCRNFARSSGRMGRRIARPIVGRFYGDRDPALLDVDAERRALSALRGSRCLASSAAGATGLVPGLSLWSELEMLAGLDCVETALRAATGNAGALFGEAHGWGRVAAGCPADLLLCAAPAGDTIAQLADAVRWVVTGGEVWATADLSDEVDDLVARSLRES